MEMSPGMRVVRGPDWNLDVTDGGEGHLGTVVGFKTEEVSAEVVWDNGQVTTCRVGKEGKHDLRIYDNATAGIQHHGTTCQACRRPNMYGLRWRCTECPGLDLCSPCYALGAHSLQHQFECIVQKGQRGKLAPAREGSAKTRVMGIFPEARVTRGFDWEYGDVDGGPDGSGVVVEVVSPESGSARNAVRVSWDSGQSLQHRLGLHGKVDLVCTEEAPGPACYVSHLPVLTKLAAEVKDPKPNQGGEAERISRAEGSVERGGQTFQGDTGVGGGPGSDTGFQVGDKVKVGVDHDVFKDIQRQASSWTRRMSRCIGTRGTVRGFTAAGEVQVEFAGDTWRICPIVLVKCWGDEVQLQVGDTVRILQDETRVRQLQDQRGGWVEPMRQALGKVGRVTEIDADGDYRVQFGNQQWFFNPLGCLPAPGASVDVLEKTESTSADPDFSRILEGVPQQLFAALSDALGASKSDMTTFMEGKSPLMQLFKAIGDGDMEKTKQMLEESPELVHQSIDNGTALHYAAYSGKPEAIRLLVAKGGDVNKGDKDDDAPIMRAIDADESRVVEVLVELGADVNTSNENGQTPLHRAVAENSPVICRFLLSRNADPNKRDVMGETPLFDAVEKTDISTEILDMLINIPNQDLRLANRRGFNALHRAALKNNPRAVERLLSRDPGLVTSRMEEKQYRAIHIAAINDHTEILQMLLRANSEVDVVSRSGQTPLHLACEEGFINSARILLDHGADVNARDKDLDTPLHCCLQTASQLLEQVMGAKSRSSSDARFQLAQFLIQKGARTDMRNRKGKTPLDNADGAVRAKLESFLQQGGNGSGPSDNVTSAGSRVPTNEEKEQDLSDSAGAKGFPRGRNADPADGNAEATPKAADPTPTNAEVSPENAEDSPKECKVQ